MTPPHIINMINVNEIGSYINPNINFDYQIASVV
jgi:hypothetical protein